MAGDWRVGGVGIPNGLVDIGSMNLLLSSDNMKIDTQVLRRLREERSWTQEHLAAVSGVSLRTVQRIEREGNASAESRLSLAAALGVDVGVLSEVVEPQPSPSSLLSGERTSPSEREELEIQGRSFQRHLAVYVLVGAFLVHRDWSSNQAIVWAHWPLMGWGIGVAVHGLRSWRRRRGTRSGEAASKLLAFGERYGVYLVMSAVFLGLDLASSGRLAWAHYPILGWGAGLLLAGRGRRREAVGG